MKLFVAIVTGIAVGMSMAFFYTWLKWIYIFKTDTEHTREQLRKRRFQMALVGRSSASMCMASCSALLIYEGAGAPLNKWMTVLAVVAVLTFGFLFTTDILMTMWDACRMLIKKRRNRQLSPP